MQKERVQSRNFYSGRQQRHSCTSRILKLYYSTIGTKVCISFTWIFFFAAAIISVMCKKEGCEVKITLYGDSLVCSNNFINFSFSLSAVTRKWTTLFAFLQKLITLQRWTSLRMNIFPSRWRLITLIILPRKRKIFNNGWMVCCVIYI